MKFRRNEKDEKTLKTVCYEIVKRIFDFLASLIFGVVLIIPCVIVAVVIMAVDPGNPFFIQERVGKNGKKIKIAKFRSMVKNADDLKKLLSEEEYAQYIKEFKLDNDPRLLPHKLGDFVRRTSIDEVPQILYTNA